MRAKALLYHFDEETGTGAQLRAILKEQHILTLTLDETHLSETVGKLVSTNAAVEGEDVSDDAPEAPFLLLSGVGDRQLDRLLAAMRRTEVSVPHKAVVTAQNRDWTLCKLMAEVAREHDMINSTVSRPRA